MYLYFSHRGEQYAVDFYDTIKEGQKTSVSVERPYFKTHHIKVYYQSPKTFNSQFGYYVNLPIANGKRKKIYLDFM